MNVWNHLICDECWIERRPGRTPTRLKDDKGGFASGSCCDCGEPTASGIYLREDPAAMSCRGTSGVHKEDD